MSEPTTADVQAELQEYLNSKDINSLFIQIVEQLLIQKPDNPIGFIVDYLVKKYPDKTKASTLGAATVISGIARKMSNSASGGSLGATQ
jgi:cAMP-dependent protein kinase regulator